MNIIPLHDIPLTFDTFWSVCPKRVGRALATAKWNAITNGGLQTKTLDRDSGSYVDIELSATPEELIAGMRAYQKKVFNEDTEDRFICHPSTWLNQGRWMDEEIDVQFMLKDAAGFLAARNK